MKDRRNPRRSSAGKRPAHPLSDDLVPVDPLPVAGGGLLHRRLFLKSGALLGAAAALGAGMVVTLAYEFCHCMQHLSYAPKSRFIGRVKRLHLLHHFPNERGNYGITNFFWDRLFGSFYGAAQARPRSAPTFNLGYDEAEGERYPWVRELTTGDARGGD